MPDVTILVVPVFSPIANLAFALRREVFIDEQNVQDDEFDAHDLSAVHIAAIAGGAVVGTLRIITLPEHTKIGRVVVRRDLRGGGIGRQLIAFAMDHARAGGASRFALTAQADKIGFYARFGFVAHGEPYDDGSGNLHRDMRTY